MTASDVQIGLDWKFDINDWQVSGDSTPLFPGDSTGGAGDMTFGIPEDADAKLLAGRTVLLRDAHMGETSGRLGYGSGNGRNASIRAFSKVSMLNVIRTAAPYSGTLRGALLYYLGLTGAWTNMDVETAVATRTVNYRGWTGNVLDAIKDLCAAQSIEMALIGKTIVFRRPFGRTLNTAGVEVSWKSDEGKMTQAVEACWYDTRPPANMLIYPLGGWTPEVQPITVGAGEVTVMDYDLFPKGDGPRTYGVSAITIQQPSCVGSVSKAHSGSSVYCVSGKDGIAITPEQWLATGGSVRAELLDGGSTLRVTVTGSTIAEYAPYTIAMSAGPSSNYSSLRIWGNGMRFTKYRIRALTGVSKDDASQELAQPVDNPFITSDSICWSTINSLIALHGGARMSASAEIGQVEGTSTSTSYFDGQEPNEDITEHPFGNLEGAMVFNDGMAYRVRSADSNPATTRIQAEEYVTAKHLNDSLTALGITTAAEWNAYFPNGMTAGEFSMRPLRGTADV